jgi:hypothetical protein
MIPPLATARTTAREVQLRGVPVPTHGQGRDASTARASRGTMTAGAAVPAAAAVPGSAVRAPASTTRRIGCGRRRTVCNRQGAMLWLRWKTLSGS